MLHVASMISAGFCGYKCWLQPWISYQKQMQMQICLVINIVREICAHLDLNKTASIMLTCFWRDHIVVCATEIKANAGQYFIRYVNIADMELTAIVHELESSAFTTAYCSILRVFHSVIFKRGFYPLARARSRCFSASAPRSLTYSAACGRTSIRHPRPFL